MQKIRPSLHHISVALVFKIQSGESRLIKYLGTLSFRQLTLHLSEQSLATKFKLVKTVNDDNMSEFRFLHQVSNTSYKKTIKTYFSQLHYVLVLAK